MPVSDGKALSPKLDRLSVIDDITPVEVDNTSLGNGVEIPSDEDKIDDRASRPDVVSSNSEVLVV